MIYILSLLYKIFLIYVFYKYETAKAHEIYENEKTYSIYKCKDINLIKDLQFWNILFKECLLISSLNLHHWNHLNVVNTLLGCKF